MMDESKLTDTQKNVVKGTTIAFGGCAGITLFIIFLIFAAFGLLAALLSTV